MTIFIVISVVAFIFLSFKIGDLQNSLINEGLLPDGQRVSFKRLKVAELNAKGDETILKKINLLRKYLWVHYILFSAFFIVCVSSVAKAAHF